MSRKYRQRGYQEEDTRRPAPGTRAASHRDGPGGRGLGAPRESSVKCVRCGQRILGEIVVDRTCDGCGSDLHTCTNCRHFDSSARFECTEPVAERIASKSVRNECRSFAARIVKGFGSDARSGEDDPKTAFDALFDF